MKPDNELTLEDIRLDLKTSRQLVNKLTKLDDFPILIDGLDKRRRVILRNSYNKWLRKYMRKTIKL